VYQTLALNTDASFSIKTRTAQHSSFPSPTPRLRGINGAERLVPKELLAEEELLLLWGYRTTLIRNSFEALLR
jgi:hypothetical protein